MKGPSVIIIGAGAAGIAAAAKLQENSIENVTILEAEDRIGGRIHSTEFGESFVELGAEYVHGEKNNVVYELTQNLDVLQQGVESMEENIYYSDGSKLKCEFLQELRNLILDYENCVPADGVAGKSVGECFIDRYNSTLIKKFGNKKEYVQILKEGLRFAEGYIVMVEGTFSWNDSSADSSFSVCDGNPSLVWKKMGYKTILEILTRSYPDPNNEIPIYDKIRLNTKVVTIFWKHENKVKVVTSNNTSYTADYVIFTPSLGVLKQNKSLFQPPLPLEKQEAIDETGFGGVVKIIIDFQKQWWKDEDRAFSFFWSEKDLQTVDFPEGPKTNNISWVTQFRDLSRVLHNSNVWIGWFGGDLVPEIEKLPCDVLKRGCQYVLNKFLGRDYEVEQIDNIVASNWCSNPNFGGVYSYVKTGKDPTFQEELGQPLRNDEGKPVVLFAGEATNPVHYATVHGAIESGFREAQRLLNFQ